MKNTQEKIDQINQEVHRKAKIVFDMPSNFDISKQLSLRATEEGIYEQTEQTCSSDYCFPKLVMKR